MNECLVYETLERVEIYSAPSTDIGYETNKFFVPGDLVSVDFVLEDPTQDKKGGKYLRLSDGSGWVCLCPPGSSTKAQFQPVPVETGLWAFFVDNFPDGIRVTNHPIDELQWQWQNLTLDQVPKIPLKPCKKVYCDKKVQGRNGTNYYRLQMTNKTIPGWVFDQRRRPDDTSKHHHLLQPEGIVKHGVFAFRAIKSLKLRMFPLANKRNLTGISIATNDVFVVDIMRGEKYYRMIDGSGWVFAAPEDMQQVDTEQGTWAFRVTTPYGVKLQTQPEDDRSSFGDVYKHNEIVVCDAKLSVQAYGRNFYHVQDTNGWISDMGREGRRVMERASPDLALKNNTANGGKGDGWTEGFVRGVSMAMMAGGTEITEISHHPESNLITFTHPNSGATLQVFYATRTVGITELGHPQVFCRNCTNAELVEIFKDPATRCAKIKAEADNMEEDEPPQDDPETLKQEEMDARNQLLSIDREVSQLQQKKDAVWKKVDGFQEKRDAKEANVQELWKNHMKQRLEEDEKLRREEAEKDAEKDKKKDPRANEKCFVFRVLHAVGVRSVPDVESKYRTDKAFDVGDLVSVETILDFVSANNSGPYLKLSDGSGWLFARDTQGTVMEEVHVEHGQWNFFVGNEPTGVGLRTHPIVKVQEGGNEFVFKEETTLNFLKPFQKVACDRRVVGKDDKGNRINFYRVQGTPKTAWIMEKRYNARGAEEVLLHPASQVRTGLFAFEAIDEIAIREQASVAKKFQTNRGVSPSEIVVADLIFEKDFENRNGPYMRLADGSGWLFVNIDGDKVMKDIPIKTGKWKFRITAPGGLKLRKQPTDKAENNAVGEIEYKEDQTVICDREIKGSNGLSWYYRPVGRDGWLANIRGKYKFMTEMEFDENEEMEQAWTVELVRGVALAAEGLEEVDHNPQTKVIVFKSSQGAAINVNYDTQNVEVTFGDPGQGKLQMRSNCSKEELVEIMKEPTVDDGCRRPSKRRRTSMQSPAQTEMNLEDDLRNRLLQLDKEEEEIKAQREAIWKSIREYEKKQSEGDVCSSDPNAAQGLSEQLKCPTCQKVFGSLYAKQMHVDSLGH